MDILCYCTRTLEVVNHSLFFFGLSAYGILVLWPGVEPGPLAVKVLSPNHWTVREFPGSGYLLKVSCNVEFKTTTVNFSYSTIL